MHKAGGSFFTGNRDNFFPPQVLIDWEAVIQHWVHFHRKNIMFLFHWKLGKQIAQEAMQQVDLFIYLQIKDKIMVIYYYYSIIVYFFGNADSDEYHW